MKDKSRLLSSVLVSLLAGFTYYIFSQDISDKVQSSVKAVFSSNDIEQYMPNDFVPFSSAVKNSDKKISKRKSKFYIKKRNTVEFKNKEETISGDELIADYLSIGQAKFRQPVPDRNIDFTAELESLISNDKKNKHSEKSKKLKDELSYNARENIASDTKDFYWNSDNMDRRYERSRGKTENSYSKGKGFEYNYKPGDSRLEVMELSDDSGVNIYFAPEPNANNNNCSKHKVYRKTKEVYEKKFKNANTKKVKIISPKIKIKYKEKKSEPDPADINIYEDCKSTESMQ